MNKDLIKQIDAEIKFEDEETFGTSDLCYFLHYCKAEIQRLESELAKAKEYVPMTDDDYRALNEVAYLDTEYSATPFRAHKALEAEVIKRARLIVKEKE